jgi:hypothetical protein
MAKDAIEFGKTVFLFLSLIGVSIWVGMIWKAEGEDKLVEACHPIDWSMDTLHDVTTGLIGREPQWTLRTQRYLMSGCYYFFSTMLKAPSEQGVRQGGVRR